MSRSVHVTDICTLLLRLENERSWAAGDCEVLNTLIQGLRWSPEIRACIHGLAAGIVAYFDDLSPHDEDAL